MDVTLVPVPLELITFNSTTTSLITTTATTLPEEEEVVNVEEELPLPYTEISPNSRNVIIAYTFLFLIGSIGNVSVFHSVSHRQLGKLLKWRITILILHLATADLIVICVVIPSEIVWRLTIQWYGGNVICKLCQFARAFGLYLSSMIIICISVDRFYAILFPLRMVNASRRVKVMLVTAWLVAGCCALPQVLVFSIQHHPKYPTFQQCVTYGFLNSETHEVVYNLFALCAMYFVPLAVILVAYTSILVKIVRKSNHQQQQLILSQNTICANGVGKANNVPVLVPGKGSSYSFTDSGPGDLGLVAVSGTGTLPFNNNGHPVSATDKQGETHQEGAVVMMARAKWKILRLTCEIVLIFLLCWTPYAVMLLWYMFDRDSAKNVNPGVQDGLFMMAVANSCLNPFVYGKYTKTGGTNVSGRARAVVLQGRRSRSKVHHPHVARFSKGNSYGHGGGMDGESSRHPSSSGPSRNQSQRRSLHQCGGCGGGVPSASTTGRPSDSDHLAAFGSDVDSFDSAGDEFDSDHRDCDCRSQGRRSRKPRHYRSHRIHRLRLGSESGGSRKSRCGCGHCSCSSCSNSGNRNGSRKSKKLAASNYFPVTSII